jgi:hypothetical protein
VTAAAAADVRMMMPHTLRTRVLFLSADVGAAVKVTAVMSY